MRLLPPRTVLVATVLAATLLAATAPLVLAAAPDQPVAVPNAGFETAGACGPALGLVARRPGPGRGRRAPRGRRPRRRRGDRARRGRAGVAARAVGEGGPPGRPRLPPLRLGEDARRRRRPARALPHRGGRDALDGLLPLHEPLARRRRHAGLDARRDDLRRDRGRGPGAARTSAATARPPDAPGSTTSTLAEVGDITEVIPLERVRWEGPAFRYEDRGWIFVHVEGAPYARGRQFGKLVSDEIAAYIQKLSIRRDAKDPAHGWAALRTLADALMLRRFDPEFLEEMKGIADGAAAAGAEVHGRKVDLARRRHDELRDRPRLDGGRPPGDAERRHRPDASSRPRTSSPSPTASTSARRSPRPGPPPPTAAPSSSRSSCGTATPASTSTWSLDVVPEKGHRFVMQTFPGGIHSGTDFYMNDAGILIGETTVAADPVRRRRARRRATASARPSSTRSSIDEVAAILREKNNGMYTNDWTLADVKRDESAILLLGTAQSKLWRSTDQPAPFGTPGFLWANNNARDAGGAPRGGGPARGRARSTRRSRPANRDVAFRRFYERAQGEDRRRERGRA